LWATTAKNRLYHNNHDGTFTDVAEKAGVQLGNGRQDRPGVTMMATGCWTSMSPAMCTSTATNWPISGNEVVGYAPCLYRAMTVNCGPRGLKGEPDHLFHNNGDGTFTDVTVKAGVEDKDKYYGFSTIFMSFNGNGKPDLVVGNDSGPNYLYITKVMEPSTTRAMPPVSR